MKLKQNTQEQICSYILEQLQQQEQCQLTENEAAAFRLFWQEQDFQYTAYKLGLSPNKGINLIQKILDKLRVRKVKPRFESLEDFLSAPIFIHPFSTRLYHVLRFMDCKNIGELLQYTEKEILRKRGVGKKALQELRTYFKESGWSLNNSALRSIEAGSPNSGFDEYEGLGRRLHNGVMFAQALLEMFNSDEWKKIRALQNQFLKEQNVTAQEIKNLNRDAIEDLNKKWRERLKKNGLLDL